MYIADAYVHLLSGLSSAEQVKNLYLATRPQMADAVAQAVNALSQTNGFINEVVGEVLRHKPIA